METKAKEQERRPTTMKGMERRRMARRPTVSMAVKATRVKIKFVTAMEREVKTGEVKPTRAKIVAEKYIKEFYGLSVK
jgi:hypothetical protein